MLQMMTEQIIMVTNPTRPMVSTALAYRKARSLLMIIRMGIPSYNR